MENTSSDSGERSETIIKTEPLSMETRANSAENISIINESCSSEERSTTKVFQENGNSSPKENFRRSPPINADGSEAGGSRKKRKTSDGDYEPKPVNIDAESQLSQNLNMEVVNRDYQAALEAGLYPDFMSILEQEELPRSARHPERYLEIRNHILRCWMTRRDRYVTKEDCCKTIRVHCFFFFSFALFVPF